MAHMRVLQLVPALRCGGVERGTVEIDAALGPSRSLVASSGGPLTNLLCGLHLHWRASLPRIQLRIFQFGELLRAERPANLQVAVEATRSEAAKEAGEVAARKVMEQDIAAEALDKAHIRAAHFVIRSRDTKHRSHALSRARLTNAPTQSSRTRRSRPW